MKPKRTISFPIERTVAVTVLLSAACAHVALGDGSAPDLDGDGIPNIVDPDVDNDGIPNALDRNIDGGIALTGPFRGQYIGDHLDNDNPAEKDIDGDNLPDDSLAEKDTDGDGKRDDDASEDDIDGDRRDDDSAAEHDIDGDGRRDDDDSEDDIDGDGRDDDDDEIEDDIDGDGIDDDTDDDIDGDNHGNGDAAEDDTDGDGRLDDDDNERNDDGDSLNDRFDDDDDNDGDPDEDDLDHHHEDDEVEVEIGLARVAAPNDSRARVKIQRMATGKIEFEIDLRDDSELMPEGDYEIVIDGIARGFLPTERDGDRLEGEVEFETNPNDDDELPLDFEVIGLPVELRFGGVVYFAGTVPTPPEPGADSESEIGSGSIALTPGDGVPAIAKAKAEVEFDALGAKELQIEIEDAPNGQFDIVIGAESRGVMAIEDGQGRAKFDRSPEEDELLLDFAVSGQPIAIRLGDAVVFFGQLPAGPGTDGGQPGGDPGPGDPPPPGNEAIAALAPAAGLSPEANAEVQVQFGIAGPVGLEVEAEDIPAGEYAVVIDGAVRAIMAVADSGNGPRGKVRFETVPNDPGELPLDFLAVGLPIEIIRDGVPFFTGTVPTLF